MSEPEAPTGFIPELEVPTTFSCTLIFLQFAQLKLSCILQMGTTYRKHDKYIPKKETDTVILVEIAMSRLNDKERQILQEFKHRVLDQFPGELLEIRVFGSMARGDATEESDIDVLVITKSDDWQIGDAIRKIGYDLDSEINYKLSIQVLPVQHINYLADNHFSFYRNVAQKGIPI